MPIDAELDDYPFNHPRYLSIIDALPIGESFCSVQRIDLSFGIGDEDRAKQVEFVRTRIDSMVARSRKKNPGRTFTVESFSTLGSRGPVMFAVAVATRLT